MKWANYQIMSLIMVLLTMTAPSQAEVAVLIGITGDSVILHRVERSEFETLEQDRSDRLITPSAMPLVDTMKLNAVKNLVIEWFDANGVLIHREARSDPRFVHAPNGEPVVLPEATVLIRAPNSAVKMRVRPRDFSVFTNFNI